MKAYALNRGENYCAWQLPEDIEQLFRSGSIDENTPCKEHRAQSWQTVADIFPQLKSQRTSSRPLYRAHDVGCWQSSDGFRRNNPKLITSEGRTSSVFFWRTASLMKLLQPSWKSARNGFAPELSRNEMQRRSA